MTSTADLSVFRVSLCNFAHNFKISFTHQLRFSPANEHGFSVKKEVVLYDNNEQFNVTPRWCSEQTIVCSGSYERDGCVRAEVLFFFLSTRSTF